MAKKQASDKPRTVGITVRVDLEENRILSAILSLKGMTLSGFLHDSIRTFIRENYEDAKKLFDLARVPGLLDADEQENSQ